MTRSGRIRFILDRDETRLITDESEDRTRDKVSARRPIKSIVAYTRTRRKNGTDRRENDRNYRAEPAT